MGLLSHPLDLAPLRAVLKKPKMLEVKFSELGSEVTYRAITLTLRCQNVNIQHLNVSRLGFCTSMKGV